MKLPFAVCSNLKKLTSVSQKGTALSPTRTRELLNHLGHHPRKRLGQNFLIDPNIVQKSLDMAGVIPGSCVVEIGPGLGTLTAGLLSTGARVFSIETDPTLAHYLKLEFIEKTSRELGKEVGILSTRFDLLEGDAVKYPRAGFDLYIQTNDIDNPGFSIVANLPYAISSPWLDRILEGLLPTSMVLMLQKESVDRYVAKPGRKSFGAISIFLQSSYDLAARHEVSRRCFYPAPVIDSSLIKLVKKRDPFIFPRETKTLIRQFFSQRRKQMANLCRGNERAMDWLKGLEKDGIPGTTRPEQIPVTAWQKL